MYVRNKSILKEVKGVLIMTAGPDLDENFEAKIACW